VRSVPAQKPTFAGDHDAADVVVGLGFGYALFNLCPVAPGHSVELLGLVEHDPCDVVADFVADFLELHV